MRDHHKRYDKIGIFVIHNVVECIGRQTIRTGIIIATALTPAPHAAASVYLIVAIISTPIWTIFNKITFRVCSHVFTTTVVVNIMVTSFSATATTVPAAFMVINTAAATTLHGLQRHLVPFILIQVWMCLNECLRWMRRNRTADCLVVISYGLIDPHIVDQHTSGQVLTHSMGHCTGTFFFATVETVTRTAFGARCGKAPSAANGCVQ
mmetsp:Transcript_20157/g.34994  ORF Transcript_20157/g.34994 Transcript_20157/m.34994 type:complete len:208 (-) Transcript_20157:1082-1705(-)